MKPNKAGPRRPDESLDRRYGEIGISALAAVLRYPGETKNPAYARVEPQPEQRPDDASA